MAKGFALARAQNGYSDLDDDDVDGNDGDGAENGDDH